MPLEAELRDELGQGRVGLAAMLAQAAHQALCHDPIQRRGQKIVLDPHVEQPGQRAGGVVGVQGREHQMAGQRRLDRDLRGLQIADLADHDHVRVVAQHRAQDMGEAQPDLRLDLDLVDAVELILDRVLDGQHLAVRRVELDQRGVERGGLAAAGRAGDQDDAVRPGQRLAIGRERLGLEAERDEVERHAAAIEHAQHHALAVHGRQGRDAQVDVLAAHREADAAVLRQPALGDVEPRHDLEARDDRGAQLGGRRLHVAQHAVDPVARAQTLLG